MKTKQWNPEAFVDLLFAARMAIADRSRWETPEDHAVLEMLEKAIAKAEGK